MSVGSSGRDEHVSPEQKRYARILAYGMQAGLLLLIATFAIYISGALPVQVPFDDLPRLWTLPVEDFLRESGIEPGWSWLALLGKGDLLAITGIALLAGVSLPCLVVLLPVYARRGDKAYLSVVVALIAVLVLAASGVFTAH